MDDETMIETAVDDTKCVLVEFEDETVAVGYLNWLTSHNNENYIQDVIEKHLDVVTRWPNCTIGPANKMRKALQKCNEWSKHMVKIVAYGDWTTMCNQLSTYIKCDDPNPGKHERKLYAKKKISESEDEEENKTKKTFKKQKKETAKLKSDAKNTIGYTILQKYKTKSNKDDKTKQIQFNNSSSSDDSIVQLQKSLDVQKLLAEKSKQLEEVNKKLIDIVHVSEAVKRLEKKIDKIADAMTTIESYLKSGDNISIVEKKVDKISDAMIKMESYLKSDNNSNKFTDNDIENSIMVLSVSDEMKTKPYDSLYISEEIKDEFQNNNTPITLHVAAELEEISEANGAASSKVDDAKEINSKEIIDVTKSKIPSTTSKICNNAVELNGCCYFGDRLVTKVQLAKLNDSSLSKLTGDLLSIVFDKKELKESSLTGQKANANKNKIATKKLDPDRVAAVEEYVYKKFGKTDDNIKLFRAAVRTKCNNAKKVASANSIIISATADE